MVLPDSRKAVVYSKVGIRSSDQDTAYAYLTPEGPWWCGDTEYEATQNLYRDLESLGLVLGLEQADYGDLVLLDVDGVLNSHKVYNRCMERPGKTVPGDWLDPECIRLLNNLCSDTGAKVILISSWRFYLGIVRAKLTFESVGGTFQVVGMTPILSDPDDPTTILPDTRWKEIQRWLTENPGARNWVILDDVEWENFPPEKFVKTDINLGLTPEGVREAKRILAHGRS